MAAAAMERISFVVVVTTSSVMTQLPPLFDDKVAVAVVAPDVVLVVEVVTMPGSGEGDISTFNDGSSHKSVLSFSSSIKSVKSMFVRENAPSSLSSFVDEGNGVPN